MTLLINCLIIFVGRIADVSLATILTVFVVRGKKAMASIIGFVDIVIWFLIAKNALSAENSSIWILLSYASGFAAGTYIGTWLEEKIAIGNSSLQIITRGERYDMEKALRDAGFAVSTVLCSGREGKNLLLIVEINRKKIKKVRDIVSAVAPDSFVTISDVRTNINGHF